MTKIDGKLKFLRIAPRKVRLVADLIRGKSVQEAEEILRFTPKGASKPVLKLLKSVISNAENNFSLERNNLYISEIRVDGGPILKRWRPRAMGSANQIQKKTSHVTLILSPLKEGKEIKAKGKEKIEKIEASERPKEIKEREERGKPTVKKEEKRKIGEEKEQRGKIFRRKSI